MGKLNKILFAVMTLLFINFSVVAQSTINENTPINDSSASLNSSIDESSIFLDTGTTTGTTYSTKSNGWFFVRMIIVLILIVVAIYFLLRYFKNKTNPTVEDSDFLRRVASINIAPGRTVEIVTLLDNKGYVLGVTESNINLIAEIGNTPEEKELISALNLTADKKQNNAKPSNFSDVLEMFVGRGKSGKKNIFEESERRVDDFINSKSSEEE